MKFTYGEGADQFCKTVPLSSLTPVAEGKYVCYLPMPANKLSAVVTAVIYNGSDAAVSSTLEYSVESYAAAMVKPNDPADALSNLVKAMIRYGDTAAAYAANPDN